MIAFKTYKDAPNNVKPASIPEEWPWFVQEIPDDQKEIFEQSGHIVLSYSDFVEYKAQRQLQYDAWANSFDQNMKGQEIRILNLVHEQFKGLHPSKIDFRRHLRSDIYLQKSVEMLPNGRPHKSSYTYNGELIAEIEFVFEVNAFNFMIRRKELLSYFRKNNTQSEQWVIADDIYDQNNPYHLREMMKERSESRVMIFEEVKAFLNGVLAQFYIPQGKSYAEILTIAGQFWDKYSTPIDSWINVGAPQFKTMLSAETDFVFLDVPVAAGVTVRSYILNKTSY